MKKQHEKIGITNNVIQKSYFESKNYISLTIIAYIL